MSSGTTEAQVITLETGRSDLCPGSRPKPFAELLPRAHLIEVSGLHACARTTTAVSCVIRAQAHRELVAWIQPENGPLFPPDLASAGVDLDALIAVHIPRHAGPFALVRAAEWLARSGAFGLTVIDLTDAVPPGSSVNWQGRLRGVLRQYDGQVLLLTSSAYKDPSSGPLIGLRVEPQRGALQGEHFEVRSVVLKNKIGFASDPASEHPIAPTGLRGAS